MPARSRERPPGPSADRRRLCVRPAIGLVWSMNCESCEVPKNSFSAATTGRMLIRDCGVMASTSWVVIRSRTTRSMRARPVRSWFWISSPTVRMRRLPKWSMSSAWTLTGLSSGPMTTAARGVDEVGRLDRRAGGVQLHDVADRGDDVVDGQRLLVEGLGHAELLVDLVATDLGQVVALGVEVVVVQQRLRSLTRGRFARAQLAVDVEQRLVLGLGGVLLQGEHHRLVLAELLADLLGGPAERLEQHGDVLLALAVEADADEVALVDLELEPGTAARDQLGGVDVLVGRLVRGERSK